MSVIGFSFIGVTLGIYLLDYALSMYVLYAMVGLAGIVVNDSLVLIDFVNQERARGAKAFDAVVTASSRRFRPILLTSLTTFVGLTPLMLETSLQAQFLIPMAISLAFGVLFSTFTTLLLTPALYRIGEDLRLLVRGAHSVTDVDSRGALQAGGRP